MIQAMSGDKIVTLRFVVVLLETDTSYNSKSD